MGKTMFDYIQETANDTTMHPLQKAARIKYLANGGFKKDIESKTDSSPKTSDEDKSSSDDGEGCCSRCWSGFKEKCLPDVEFSFPDQKVTMSSCLLWWIILIATVICTAFAQEFANSGSSWEFVVLTTSLAFFMVFLCCCCFGGRCCWECGPGKCVLQLAVLFQLGYTIYAYIGNWLFRTVAYCSPETIEDFLKENPHEHSTGLRRHICGEGSFEVLAVPVSNMMAMYNYSYIIVDRDTGDTAYVDPSVPSEINRIFEDLKEQWKREGRDVIPKLSTVLITHRHHDHAGGNKELVENNPKLRVVGGYKERVPHANVLVKQNDVLGLGKRTKIRALETYGHTVGHICFHIYGVGGVDEDKKKKKKKSTSSPSNSTSNTGRKLHTSTTRTENNDKCGVVFTGDALFICGIGNLFEGGEKDWIDGMRHVAALPVETLMFPGHEYTEFFAPFAAWLEPTNTRCLQKLDFVIRQRFGFDYPLSTVPSTIGEELLCNPFLRALTDTSNIARSLGRDPNITEYGMLKRIMQTQAKTYVSLSLSLSLQIIVLSHSLTHSQRTYLGHASCCV
jgi:hydroxyacylglutathione hydrolase